VEVHELRAEEALFEHLAAGLGRLELALAVLARSGDAFVVRRLSLPGGVQQQIEQSIGQPGVGLLGHAIDH